MPDPYIEELISNLRAAEARATAAEHECERLRSNGVLGEMYVRANTAEAEVERLRAELAELRKNSAEKLLLEWVTVRKARGVAYRAYDEADFMSQEAADAHAAYRKAVDELSRIESRILAWADTLDVKP